VPNFRIFRYDDDDPTRATVVIDAIPGSDAGDALYKMIGGAADANGVIPGTYDILVLDAPADAPAYAGKRVTLNLNVTDA
jgi:hypothetical protein